MTSPQEYHVRWRGRIIGKWSSERVTAMLHSGQISKHHEVSTDSSEWSSIKSHPDFAELLMSRPSDSRLGDVEAASDDEYECIPLDEPSPAPAPTPKLTLKPQGHPPPHTSVNDFQANPEPLLQRPSPPPDMIPQDRWYYALNNQVLGPVKESDLSSYILSGAISDDTQVCRQGTEDWLPARTALPDHFARPASRPVLHHQNLPSPSVHLPQPSGLGWFFEAWRRFGDFSGRSCRREYWIFFFCNFLVLFGLIIVEDVFGLFPDFPNYVLYTIYALAAFIPGLSVLVRRLHDTGRSGGWVLISFLPIIGGIVLLVFTLEAGHTGDNQYGANPIET